MLNGDMYVAERTMEMHVGRELRQAEASRLSRQARTEFSRVISARAGRLLREAGQLLVALSATVESSGVRENAALRGAEPR